MTELFREIGEILSAGREKGQWLGVIAGDRTRDTRLRCAAIDQYARTQGKSARSLLVRLSEASLEQNEEIRETALLALASISSGSDDFTELNQPVARQTSAATDLPRRGWRSKAAADPSISIRWLALLED